MNADWKFYFTQGETRMSGVIPTATINFKTGSSGQIKCRNAKKGAEYVVNYKIYGDHIVVDLTSGAPLFTCFLNTIGIEFDDMIFPFQYTVDGKTKYLVLDYKLAQ